MDKRVKSREQSTIIPENVYVVLLVSAWASILLLAIVVVIGFLAWWSLPNDFWKTITMIFEFFDTAAKGWNKGVDEIKRNYPGTGIRVRAGIIISELVQFVRSLDVSALLEVCQTDRMLHSVTNLIDIKSFIQNAKVKISLIAMKMN